MIYYHSVEVFHFNFVPDYINRGVTLNQKNPRRTLDIRTLDKKEKP